MNTSDGVSLSAWWIPNPQAEGSLILLHGYGACKADLLDLAASFHQGSRFHLLLLDFRAHGDSAGQQVSFGNREVLDVEAALSFLAEKPESRHLPVGCFGISMGGAVAILAAVRFPVIRAVAVDSVYADLAKAIATSQWLTYHIPRVPWGQLALWGTEFRLGCRLQNLSPIRVVNRLAPRSLLVMHGMEDVGIPSEEGRMLYEAAGKPKDLWLVPGAGHASCFYLERQTYPRRVLEFFRNDLR